MATSKFEDILRNLHFSDNTKDDKSGKGYKGRSPINRFNQSFSNSDSNDDSESIGKHMIKFKGSSSTKQYVKNNSSKWGFKFWYCCASDRGYIYQLDLYLGKKENAEKNLGPGVVLKMTESLQNSHCIFFLIIF